jgi:hypothetical protein
VSARRAAPIEDDDLVDEKPVEGDVVPEISDEVLERAHRFKRDRKPREAQQKMKAFF